MDVTYLPAFEGKKTYLFVAIDRATRSLFYRIYEAKTSENTEDFMNRCLEFFPFEITHVLTDNGLEFTNRLIRSKKGELCQKPSKLDEICKTNHIEHRLTQPNTPKTNGMVERANGIIKKETILKENYANKEEMVEKWFMLKPEIFKQNPCEFKNKIILLKPIENPSFHKQPCET